MSDFPKELSDAAAQIERGQPPSEVSVRTLLSWFGASRRGYWIVKEVRRALQKAGVRTDPDFESAYIDATVRIVAKETKSKSVKSEAASNLPPDSVAVDVAFDAGGTLVIGGSIDDPTYRIGKLEAANRRPMSIAPDRPLSEALTLMLANDFSQLPVMTGERDVKGVISWLSVGRRLTLGHRPSLVREAMDPHQEISADRSLFVAIGAIVQGDYVLVRAADNRIVGIVTGADLSRQFRQLAEPFLLLGEIENHIRKLIDGRFNQAEIAALRDPADVGRQVTRVSDLTFGEYIRLLEEPQRWEKIRLGVDRKVFIDELQRIREIRNDVMHFDPDGLPESDLLILQRVARFLQQLFELGAGSGT